MPGKRKAVKQPDGSFVVELKPGGTKVRVAAQPDDFDAHQFEVMAEAANALPRTARGGVRDLAPDDTRRDERMTVDAAMPSAPQPTIPTLAETEETRRHTRPQAPQMDTIYVSPEERERRRRIEAAALKGARVRHGADVHFYDPEKPVSL